MSRSRSFASLASNVDSTGTILPAGISASVDLDGIDVYDSASLLPISGLTAGNQALVDQRLYITNGTGWFNVALINFNPSIDSGPDGADYTLDSTNTVSISLIASDSDGTPITWSFTTSDSATDLATITNDSDGSFNVTGKSLADILSAGYDSAGGSFTVTFKASDGISFDTDSASFTLTYSVGGNFDWSATTQQAKIQASDAEASDKFGHAIAIDGDTVIVGAYLEDTGGSGAGAAYIFTRSGSTWTQQQKIQASDAQASDSFGFSVAIDGDTAIVGAYAEDTGGSAAGAAYIFTRSGSTWTQQQKIQASDVASPDYFGISVSIDGDTAIVGAYGKSTSTGAAYIFTRSGSSWTQQAKIQASDKAAYDNFGWAVSIDGDTVIVGAHGEDTGGTDAGAAYIFTRSGSSWTQQQKIQASDIVAYDNFGRSVAIDGDTVIAGAWQEDDTATNAGSAYIFTRSGSTWTQQDKIQASDAEGSDNFGQSAAIDGDTVIVGAWQEDTGGSGAGAAYIFTRDGSTWTQQQKIQSSDIGEGDQFSYSVSISGDTAIVGARNEDTGGTDAGAAYIFVADES